MDELEQEKDRKRSPNYPSISLQAAVARIAKLYPKIGVNAGTKEVLAAEWGTTAKSSGFLQAVGSLGKYGLLRPLLGVPKKFKLTKEALDIVMLPDTDTKHVAALKRAALNPKVFRDLWERHGADFVSDDDLNHELVTVYEFRPDAAADAVRQYRASIEFAKLGKDDKVTETTGGDCPEIGDLIQWRSQGVDQFKEPQKVAAKSEDGRFLFIFGEPCAIPIEQTFRTSPVRGERLEETAQQMQQPNPPQKETPDPPPPGSHFRPPLPVGIKQYTYTVDTGDAVFRWPSVLSPEDALGIEAWLESMKAKIKRSVQAEHPEKPKPRYDGQGSA